MKKLIFNTCLFCLTFLVAISCSDRVAKVYGENSFKGRIFVSEKYNGGLKAKLQFSDKLNELNVLNLPYDVSFTKKYEIFPGDESPSGRPTISVESWYYFIIQNENKLIYRYYEGSHEKTLIFREVLK